MKRKNDVSLKLLFLSVLYLIFCCVIFFALALIIVKLIINHEVNISRSDIEHVLVASGIAGTAAGLRSWFFAKIDERNVKKSPPSEPKP